MNCVRSIKVRDKLQMVFRVRIIIDNMIYAYIAKGINIDQPRNIYELRQIIENKGRHKQLISLSYKAKDIDFIINEDLQYRVTNNPQNNLKLYNLLEDILSDSYYDTLYQDRLKNIGIQFTDFNDSCLDTNSIKLLYTSVRLSLINEKILIFNGEELKTAEELQYIQQAIITREADVQTKSSSKIGSFRNLFIITNSLPH